MTYVVIELQTNSDGTVGTLTNAYTNRSQAEQAYHTILAAAAVSSLPVHAAVMLQNDGLLVHQDAYEHEQED